MTIRNDPEKNESRALFEIADFRGKHVLEIGCGDGRITWNYAHAVAHVTAIDPFEGSILRARDNQPESLQEQVTFRHIAFEDLAAESDPEVYDIVILSWALC
ncbi:MAG: methyltransferase domain-containing protein [Chloroflexota bacterium]